MPVQSGVRERRPRVWGDCGGYGGGACPWVGCRYHLYLDVREGTGTIQYNFPGVEPEELEATCALWVAEGGGVTLERVGELLNLTRERARQIESHGVGLLRRYRKRLGV